MNPDFCTEEETVGSRGTCVEYSSTHCVEPHLEQRHTSKWQTDTLMATAVLLGAAPTLTSVAGLSAVAGVIASDTDTLSLHRKRSSSQTKYLKSMTGYTLHMWPNGTVSGVRSYDNSSRKYAMLDFVTTIATLTTIWKKSNEDPKVEIRGVESKMWLCMNDAGALYGSVHKTNECEFYEEFDRNDYWNTYYSVQHPSHTEKSVKWYIALNKHGRPRTAMTTKHRSSRFKTQATQSRTDAPQLPEEFELEIPRRHRTYKRVQSGDKSKTNRPKTVRKSEKRTRERSGTNNLSNILSSIEKVLAADPKSTDSESFEDSMLIDLGKNNPFSNIGDRIRHPAQKIGSKRRKSPKKRKNYHRKKSGKSRQR